MTMLVVAETPERVVRSIVATPMESSAPVVIGSRCPAQPVDYRTGTSVVPAQPVDYRTSKSVV